ncbi:MAG: hypothetical protein U1F54_04895 [Burkholderiales bacterium]
MRAALTLRFLVTIAGTTGLLFSGRAVADPQSERPSFSLGDSWSYSVTDYPITQFSAGESYKYTLNLSAINKTFYLVSRTKIVPDGPPSNMNMRWSLDGNRLARAPGGDGFQEFRAFQWPLIEGAKWSFRFPTNEDTEATWEVNVGGWETIDVAAGRFRAIRVDATYAAFSFQFAVRSTITFWYSPEVKRYVRTEEFGYARTTMYRHRVEELTSYKLI